jgi:uncharacterized protein
MNAAGHTPGHAPEAPIGGVRSGTTPAEQAFSFDVEGASLIGILHPPAGGLESGRAATGVLIVVGGPQYRAGSHRQFVQLARHLAAAGRPVLRFDVRGMGDSEGQPRSFEQISPDIGAAIAALRRRQPQVTRVVLWGLCDGASAALLYLDERPDPQVQGLVLVNPWVRSETTLARAQVRHYYRQRLLQRSFWSKLLSGSVARQALGDFWRSLRAARGRTAGNTTSGRAEAPFQQRMARAWRGFCGPILLVLSGRDLTACEFVEAAGTQPEWQGALQREGVTRRDVAEADHTFSAVKASAELEAISAQWLDNSELSSMAEASRRHVISGLSA